MHPRRNDLLPRYFVASKIEAGSGDTLMSSLTTAGKGINCDINAHLDGHTHTLE